MLANLLLPLVNFSQKGLQHGLNRFVGMSFNRGYKLLIARTLVLHKYTLYIQIWNKSFKENEQRHDV